MFNPVLQHACPTYLRYGARKSCQKAVYTVPDSYDHDMNLTRLSALPTRTTFHIWSFYLIFSYDDNFKNNKAQTTALNRAITLLNKTV